MNEKLTYHRAGDYLLPDLVPLEAPCIKDQEETDKLEDSR